MTLYKIIVTCFECDKDLILDTLESIEDQVAEAFDVHSDECGDPMDFEEQS